MNKHVLAGFFRYEDVRLRFSVVADVFQNENGEMDFDFNDVEIVYYHPLTNGECARVEQCFFNWSEQDDILNRRWERLEDFIRNLSNESWNFILDYADPEDTKIVDVIFNGYNRIEVYERDNLDI